MDGAKSRKTAGRHKDHDERRETGMSGVGSEASGDASGGELKLHITETIQSLTRDLQNEMKSLKADLKRELADFKDEFGNDFKKEFNNFRSEVNQKLQTVAEDVRDHGARMIEVEKRIEEVESANTELKNALLHTLKHQKLLRAQLTDLEGRSRHNNVRIYGIKEGAEGTSMIHFIDSFLKKELGLENNTDLQIQRAHRSLGPKPQNEEVSRSILVNFQRYDVKDRILKTAWSKKITFEGRAVTVAHDLPTEVNNKLREYKDIKKVLKEKQIRFQTPYPAKMRIHWESGPRTYNNAAEVREDMNKRGFQVEPRQTPEISWEQRLARSVHWNRVDGGCSTRAREKLEAFRRQPD
ncbi:uncharacterized protein LOC127533172 [Acanthochromis polyacanthus]|uniref:uncharacterized protein LOC127533172 n=1 Tax=Acanthochromis polyacanthus TaxID=80966 RepID=UPI0022341429|nr:uncharacterized protein LOC127533172 [Acanthochromis polyacanthus]